MATLDMSGGRRYLTVTVPDPDGKGQCPFWCPKHRARSVSIDRIDFIDSPMVADPNDLDRYRLLVSACFYNLGSRGETRGGSTPPSRTRFHGRYFRRNRPSWQAPIVRLDHQRKATSSIPGRDLTAQSCRCPHPLSYKLPPRQ